MVKEMISFGAGVNSVAMTVMLVERGWRGPIVFSDTGCEYPETYLYMDYFEREFLSLYGVGLTRLDVGSKYHRRSKATLEQYCLEKGIVPFLATRWCAGDWKIKPLLRWGKTHNIDVQLQAFSIDEPQRLRDGKYPLVEANITRIGCVNIISRAGLEIPHRSHCFFCPGQTLEEFKLLYYSHPDLYERAAMMEKNACVQQGKEIGLKWGHNLRQLSKQWLGQTIMNL